jgi:hypothetical protein
MPGPGAPVAAAGRPSPPAPGCVPVCSAYTSPPCPSTPPSSLLSSWPSCSARGASLAALLGPLQPGYDLRPLPSFGCPLELYLFTCPLPTTVCLSLQEQHISMPRSVALLCCLQGRSAAAPSKSNGLSAEQQAFLERRRSESRSPAPAPTRVSSVERGSSQRCCVAQNASLVPLCPQQLCIEVPADSQRWPCPDTIFANSNLVFYWHAKFSLKLLCRAGVAPHPVAAAQHPAQLPAPHLPTAPRLPPRATA